MAKFSRLLGIFYLNYFVHGFSWATQKALRAHKIDYQDRSDEIKAVPIPRNHVGIGSYYEDALRDLESLESQPLCHRIAARLLIHNCHLLHGRDETAELADSGRATRDFIDSYAAGLAICDLERGSFAIPRECAKFREPALAKLETAKTPHLHASTLEIDRCLEGLAQSDSSWNTWISYRHRAVRFCEIAKSENEKDYNIGVHKKITKIMNDMADNVAKQIQEQLHQVDNLVQKTAEAADSIIPRTESIETKLHGIDQLVQDQLVQGLKKSAIQVQAGLADAVRLQNVVSMLLDSIHDSQTKIAAEHGNALEVVRRDASDGLEAMMTTIANVASSSLRLQNQLEETDLRAERIIEKQDVLEENLDRLQTVSQEIVSTHKNHESKLNMAQNSVMSILETLQSVESCTSRLQTSLLGGTRWSWWPHIFCPAASLFLGSYRLAPSMARNILLLGIGEVAGVAISTLEGLQNDKLLRFTASALPATWMKSLNDTTYTTNEKND